MTVLVCSVAFGAAPPEVAQQTRSGRLQMMLVPLGCPTMPRSALLKNNTLENSLPAAALRRRARIRHGRAAPLPWRHCRWRSTHGPVGRAE
jgi:hypothetical protein